MTKVIIEPGICGLKTVVTATAVDEFEVELSVSSSCDAVTKMMQVLGNKFDSYSLCLKKPGENELYEYASKEFPAHAACPTLSGIVKAAEVECKLALPKNVSIRFEQE